MTNAKLNENIKHMSMTGSSREWLIDVLRCVGTLLVILAHVNPPNTIALLRSFDVCLLVMISGYCYHYNSDFFDYIKKRVKRLCFPAWITATIIIVLAAFFCVLTHKEYIYSIRQIVETYFFLGGMEGGIGLFWIVRIYLLIALIGPLALYINKKVNNNYYFILLIAAVIIINQIVYILFWHGDGSIVDIIIENIIMSTLGYSVVFAIGNRIRTKKIFLKTIAVFSSVATVICIAYFLTHHYKYVVSVYKYPPQLVYVIFGITGSVLLWHVFSNIFGNNEPCKIGWIKTFVIWFSQKSYEIYFAHAIVLCFRSWGDRYLSKIEIFHNWAFTYFYVLLLSCFIVYFKDQINNFFLKRKIIR